MRRALVSAPRVPQPDHDRGSQRVDSLLGFLLDDGWSVTFIADDEVGDERAAHRLRQRGVATYAGHEQAREVLRHGRFDLALLAFWEPAEKLMRTIRRHSPATTIVVDSVDVHFLREARRHLGSAGRVDSRWAALLARELNTYRDADLVLTVSAKEAQLLGEFIGPQRLAYLPLDESLPLASEPFEARSGLLFVGNFRHLPNQEALDYLCREVLPLVPSKILTGHPLSVVGHRLQRGRPAWIDPRWETRLIGWVPSVAPYLARARVLVAPLRHGAGVKGKIVQAMVSGTPVVTTGIGAEGLDLIDSEHALISDTPDGFAASIAQLLTEPQTWSRLSGNARAHAATVHSVEGVRQRFRSLVDKATAGQKPIADSVVDRKPRPQRREARRRSVAAVRRVVAQLTSPGAVLVVASGGDEELVTVESRTCWHFRCGEGIDAGGADPATTELLEVRTRGARYLVLPDSSFAWLRQHAGFAAHVDEAYDCLHRDARVIVYDLGPVGSESAVSERRAPEPAARVLVLGSFDPASPGPPDALRDALGESLTALVEQRWAPSPHRSPPANIPVSKESVWDWFVLVDDRAVVPPGYLDDLLRVADLLGADRVQPSHSAGPSGGSPVTERVCGCVGRLLPGPAPVPLLAVRAGAAIRGPTVILDELPIGLTQPISEAADVAGFTPISDVIVGGSDAGVRDTRGGAPAPSLSVVIATRDRPKLLADCLQAFHAQTVSADAYEIVVVDDGSSGDETESVIDRFRARLPLRSVRIEAAGRSAAKNIGVQLARGQLVLFFDDDDRPAADLIEQHLLAHRAQPDESTAILGHTGWAPELDVSPLMHFLTAVDRSLFAYENLRDGQVLDWRGFWEGRLSCKRSLLVGHGLHDQRLEYSVDVELGVRLAARRGLRVRFVLAARSWMARPIDLDDMCRRAEGKGRAAAVMALLHPDDEAVRRYANVQGAPRRWRAAEPVLHDLVNEARALESNLPRAWDLDDPRLPELYRRYRAVREAFEAKGACAGAAERESRPSPDRRPPALQLSITIPVWSRTVELADLAEATIERVWDVARMRIEVIVVDNGSPHRRAFRARTHRFNQNRGVATGWNTGIRLAEAPVIIVMNSDCYVEPGWDDALHEAARSGRRVAFPYTDHGDGLGFRRPDQAGTAGWCFALTRELYAEIGPFDERFNPAFGEDTDYWQRAWTLGVALSPVRAARVKHARRSTAKLDPASDLLLRAHRYKYAWKHGVDPHRAPPFYGRPIVDYEAAGSS